MPTRHDEGALARRTTPGPELYFHATLPEGRPEVVVGLLHGFAEHGARYAHVADAWAERGIGTVAIDMRGHGRAGGERGYCQRFSEYLDDVKELLPLVRERGQGAPAFLFGHSFGGLVASSSALADASPWRGLALSGPYFGLALSVPPVRLWAGRVASRLAPKLRTPTGLGGANVTPAPARAPADHQG